MSGARVLRDALATQTVLRLLENARYEVLPTPATEAKVIQHLPRDRVVTVTASPSKGLEATLELSGRLARHGYVVVPHLAARMISGRAELAEIVDRLTGQGINQVFVPAGDADPVGDYPDALSLLEELARMDAPFGRIESPDIPNRTRASTTM